MRRYAPILLALFFGVATGIASNDSTAWGDDEEIATEPLLLATVNEIPIYANQVERRMQAFIGDDELAGPALVRWQAETLRILIQQEIVAGYLVERNLSASEQDIDLEIARFEERLSEQELSLDAFLLQAGMTLEQLRREISWNLSWTRCLDRMLTDEHLQNYFEEHRRDYDGSALRVSHLILLVEEAGGEGAIAEAMTKANEIREKIDAGELEFSEAVMQFSESPSAAEGGNLGWIRRHEPMPEAFSRAAFALQIGEISPPVISSHGVHLIRCEEERLGELTWEASREEIASAAARALFEKVLAHCQSSATVEYSGAIPYIDLESGELIQNSP